MDWRDKTAARAERQRYPNRPKKDLHYFKEILLMTPAPLSSPVRLVPVPRELDWKFIDNKPPPDDSGSGRYFVHLEQEVTHAPSLRQIWSGEHKKRVTENLDLMFEGSVAKGIPESGCTFECTAHLGKTAWYIDKDVLSEQQPFQLERFSKPYEVIRVPELKHMVKQDWFSRVTTDEQKLLTELCDAQISELETEKYIYLQVFNRKDAMIMYRVKVVEEPSCEGPFQLAELWSPKTLKTSKADFACFGRAHDLRVSCRCATDEIPTDVRDDIKAIVSSCMRNDDGDLQMMLRTKNVVVGHIFDKTVHKFPPRDNWVVNYVTQTNYTNEKRDQKEYEVVPPLQSHCCEEIEVMLNMEYRQERNEEIKASVLKLIHFSLGLVDMAEVCLDPNKQ